MTRLLPSICLLGLLALTGCGRDPNVVTTAPRTVTTTPSGFTEVKTSGVDLSFPKEWKVIDMSTGQMDQGIDKAFGSDPKNAALLSMVKSAAASGKFKLMVIDLASAKSGFASNCNLVVGPVPKNTSLEAIVKATTDQLKPMLKAGTTPESEYVQLPAGRTAKLKYEASLATSGVPSYSCLQYYLVNGANVYVVTFSAKPDAADAVAKIADQSIRFTN